MPNKKLCSPKTDYKTNNHLPRATKKYVIRKQTTKQIITCRAQQKTMLSENRLQNKYSRAVSNKKLRSLKTDYETNNHVPCPTKNYVVQKQTTKQIITCRAQQKNM